MNQTTVTMPMHEYEGMKKQIEQLKNESVNQFIDRMYISLEENKYTANIDMNKVNEYLDKEYPDRLKAVYSRAKASSYERPTVPMTCISCGHREFAKFTTIHNCPQCKGLVVDNYYRGIIETVLEKAGYVDVRSINVNDILSAAVKEINKTMTKEQLKGSLFV